MHEPSLWRPRPKNTPSLKLTLSACVSLCLFKLSKAVALVSCAGVEVIWFLNFLFIESLFSVALSVCFSSSSSSRMASLASKFSSDAFRLKLEVS